MFLPLFVVITLERRFLCSLDHFAVVETCNILRLVFTNKDFYSKYNVHCCIEVSKVIS